MSGNRRERSRSPMRQVGKRRDKNKNMDSMVGDMSNNGNNMMNQQMMIPNMYQQGNQAMMMATGMYQNMMLPNTMIGTQMMPTGNMDLMTGSGMDIISQNNMEMAAITQPPLPPMSSMPAAGATTAAASMDMTMMGGMMMDPAMMGNMTMYPNMGGEMSVERKDIVLKHCKLSPPPSGTTEPSRRVRPPGCRTIFVGGLPDNIRENVVREVFENYGRIHTLRLSTKNFCHIRFDRETCVDSAMMISGYRIQLLCKDKEEEDSKANTGWLHVDYALSRDDQNEYERRQRQAMRVQEAQMQTLTAQQKAIQMYRAPSPVRIQPFSNGAIVQLQDKIKSEEQFAVALPTLITWLERGDCSKKNSAQFYSMIQSTNSHIRRLFSEKIQAEQELEECKERIKLHIQKVIEQLEQVAKVFSAATHQRVWDHFTKPQRKNIETWQKMTQEFNTLKEEFNEKFYNEENDGYNNMNMNMNMEMEDYDETRQLKLENDSLRFQLEAYKNEVSVMKTDAQKELEKFKAQFIARQALQGAFENKNPPLPSPVEKPPPPPPLPEDLDSKVHLKTVVEAGIGEAKLIGVMAAFLQVHPQGASLDYVVSYVRALFPHISQATVHHVLQKHTDAFQRSTSGVGANIEHKWMLIAFQKEDTAA